MNKFKFLPLIFLLCAACASNPLNDPVIQSIKGSVVVSSPQRVEARDSYRSKKGPVWVWETTFKETSGILGATITHKEVKIDAPNGSVWENVDPKTKEPLGKVKIKDIKIRPGGSGSYKYIIRDPSHTICNGICSLVFYGEDDNKNPLVLPTMLILSHSDCPKRVK